MRDLNKVMLIGNLTRDPELRSIPSGQSVASFAIATNRAWNDAAGQLQKAVEYTDIVAWGKLAEIANQILKKGRRVYVEGRLQTRNWEGQDGVKRYKTEVIASDLIVLDRPQSAGWSNNQENAESVPTEQATPENAEPVGATASPKSDEIDIEDIPF
ncbi:single-stranded DNA-binding protein [Patescibacteria group bacterium]|nr:single-stranded DNA-binding protein [Patescibacteria group bacterium]